MDKIVELGDAFNYDIHAIDLSELTGWWINDTTRFTIDTDGIITNKLTLGVGLYGIFIEVADIYGNTLNGSFSVLVRDTTPPSWATTPQDQTITYEDLLSYRLVATDLSGIARWTVNDTEHFSIDSDGLLTDTDTLEIGVYNVEITVYDEHENSLSVILTITVRQSGMDPMLIVVLGGVVVGVCVVMGFTMLRIRKIVKIRSVASMEGKEDLGTALDYLDQIQEEHPSDDEP